ncbi:hypothetical protein WR25_24458 isoform D [Diploscapter pachys]|uniref:DNA mismatch repair proteins mutS family domain-containing protein n=1 Tax=Diploscapter pachys TaxID=2018661 RepID=A0A2A2LJP6_9BILA|nr:hypothetical protein WR25_24458 isoform D [Diploscapter pachys]
MQPENAILQSTAESFVGLGEVVKSASALESLDDIDRGQVQQHFPNQLQGQSVQNHCQVFVEKKMNLTLTPISSAREGGAVTTNNNTINRSARSNAFVAVAEGRDQSKGSFAVAVMHLRSLQIELCQFVDSAEFTRLKARIQVADPQEIILAESCNEKGSSTVLADALRTHFNWANLSLVHRRYFNAAQGVQLIEHLGNKEVSHLNSSVFEKDLCMSACAALLKFVEHIQNVCFYAHSLQINYCPIEDCCIMDIGSWQNLELMEQSKNKPSLLSLINFTLTSNGFRMLRSNVLQPCANEASIRQRREAVTDLVQDQHLFEKLRQLLSRMHDLDGLLTVYVQTPKETTVQTAENLIKQLLRLYQTLSMVQSLHNILKEAELDSQLLKDKRESLADPRLTQIIDLLEEHIDPCVLKAAKKNSIALRNQKCYAIKNKISVKLDLARRTYEELLNDIRENFSSKDNVRIAFSISRGFHFVWVCRDPLRAILPPIFIREVRNRASITFTSRNMIRYNDRVEQAVAEVMIATNVIALDILEQIRPLVACLYRAMDTISTIDFVCSLAMYSVSAETVCPITGNQIVIQKGCHPLLNLKSSREVVANDTYLTVDARFAIITGPNMTGKSTYLKQVCQLCILSQIGCFIPAEFAIIPGSKFAFYVSIIITSNSIVNLYYKRQRNLLKFACKLPYSIISCDSSFISLNSRIICKQGNKFPLPVLRQIFSRIGHNDCLEKNQSAFAVEMTEMASILQYADEQSLVVIDELARSTSVEEGIGMSYAISESLLKKKCFVFLATHFLDLTSLGATHLAVENFHFETAWKDKDNGDEDCTHTLMKGPYKGPVYGFELADLSTFPVKLLDRAKEMAERLKQEGEKNRQLTNFGYFL